MSILAILKRLQVNNIILKTFNVNLRYIKSIIYIQFYSIVRSLGLLMLGIFCLSSWHIQMIQCQTCTSGICSSCSNSCNNGDLCSTQTDCMQNACEFGMCARCTATSCTNGSACATSADCVKSTILCGSYNKTSL